MQTVRLLIVDDQVDMGSFLKTVAESCGFEVAVTSEPEAFKMAFWSFQPNLVMLDLFISKTNGTELLQFLAEAGCAARVVIISGSSQQALDTAVQFGRAHGLNMAGAIRKPMRVAELRQQFQELRKREEQSEFPA